MGENSTGIAKVKQNQSDSPQSSTSIRILVSIAIGVVVTSLLVFLPLEAFIRFFLVLRLCAIGGLLRPLVLVTLVFSVVTTTLALAVFRHSFRLLPGLAVISTFPGVLRMKLRTWLASQILLAICLIGGSC